MQSRGRKMRTNDKEEDCLVIANRLVDICQLPYPSVRSLSMIQSKFFVMLFERVFGIPLPDLLLEPLSIEDESHNVQVVIDTLALDIFSLSLSYITGEDIMNGNAFSIHNLLEVFEYYLQCLQSSSRSNNGPSVCKHCGYQEKPSTGRRKPFDKGPCPICDYANGSQLPVCERNDKDLFLARLQQIRSPIGETIESECSITTPKRAITDVVSSISAGSLSGAPKAGAGRTGVFTHHSVDQTETVPKFVSTIDSTMRKNADVAPSSSSRHTSSRRTSDTPTLRTVVSRKGRAQETTTKSTAEFGLQCEMNDVSLSSHLPTENSDSLNGLSSSGVIPFSDRQSKIIQTNGLVVDRDKPKHVRKKSKVCLPPVHQDVAEMYGRNLEEKVKQFLEEKTQHKQRASEIRKTYLRTLRTPMKRKRQTHILNKSYVLPYNLRPASTSSVTPKSKLRPPFQCPVTRRNLGTPSAKDESTFINQLREAFPGISLSPRNVQCMIKKYQNHLLTMRKNIRETVEKKSHIQVQTEEAMKRQKTISNILKKEAQHAHRLKSLKEQKQLEMAIQASEREARIEAARLKHYQEEFTNEMQRKRQQQNISDELLLKKAFEQSLALQKEQVRVLRQEYKEREQHDKRNHQLYLDSLENFYQTQFSMLAQSLAVEKRDMEERIKEQQRVLRMIKRENRAKLENEVKLMQDQILRVNEELQFREQDAEHFVERLRDKYSAHPNRKL